MMPSQTELPIGHLIKCQTVHDSLQKFTQSYLLLMENLQNVIIHNFYCNGVETFGIARKVWETYLCTLPKED